MRDLGQIKSLRSLINRSGSHLETLQLEASIQARRARRIKELLPNDLKCEIKTGDLNYGLLTLYVSNAALASKLRFEEYNLITALQNDSLFRGIRRIKCRVRLEERVQVVTRHATVTRCPNAGAFIQEFSETLDDQELKHQFQRLAARVSGNHLPDQK